ncbi:MAG: hypothetical protein ACLFVU_14285, partial [Phycisphaerae bacterium]
MSSRAPPCAAGLYTHSGGGCNAIGRFAVKLEKTTEDILRQIETVFRPAPDGQEDTVDRLSDGLKSLFYLSMVAAAFDIEGHGDHRALLLFLFPSRRLPRPRRTQRTALFFMSESCGASIQSDPQPARGRNQETFEAFVVFEPFVTKKNSVPSVNSVVDSPRRAQRSQRVFTGF